MGGKADITMPRLFSPSAIEKESKSSKTTPGSSFEARDAYLAEKQKSAIEHWNNTVPKKAIRTSAVHGGQDHAIQAYLNAKMDLFRNADLTKAT